MCKVKLATYKLIEYLIALAKGVLGGGV
jgi:hypothetical protein